VSGAVPDTPVCIALGEIRTLSREWTVNGRCCGDRYKRGVRTQRSRWNRDARTKSGLAFQKVLDGRVRRCPRQPLGRINGFCARVSKSNLAGRCLASDFLRFSGTEVRTRTRCCYKSEKSTGQNSRPRDPPESRARTSATGLKPIV